MAGGRPQPMGGAGALTGGACMGHPSHAAPSEDHGAAQAPPGPAGEGLPFIIGGAPVHQYHPTGTYASWPVVVFTG